MNVNVEVPVTNVVLEVSEPCGVRRLEIATTSTVDDDIDGPYTMLECNCGATEILDSDGQSIVWTTEKWIAEFVLDLLTEDDEDHDWEQAEGELRRLSSLRSED